MTLDPGIITALHGVSTATVTTILLKHELRSAEELQGRFRRGGAGPAAGVRGNDGPVGGAGVR